MFISLSSRHISAYTVHYNFMYMAYCAKLGDDILSRLLATVTTANSYFSYWRVGNTFCMWILTSAVSSFPSAASRSAATGPVVFFGSEVSSSGNVGSRDDIVCEVDESPCGPFALEVANIVEN